MKHDSTMHTLILVIILLAGLGTIWYAQGNKSLQLTAGIAMSVAYVFWGILRHAMIGDLHRRLVVEYVLIGLIAIVLLVTIGL
jgi:hypothetical protein